MSAHRPRLAFMVADTTIGLLVIAGLPYFATARNAQAVDYFAPTVFAAIMADSILRTHMAA